MSASTKRKFVTAEAENEVNIRPDKDKGERFARLVAPRGNNLHEVESPSLEDESKLERFLVSMPKKFRKSIWVKRGDFVIITPIEEGDKVKAEIEKVLLKDSVKELKKEKAFPAVFDPNPDSSKSISDEEEEESDDDLFRNPNRPVIEMSDSDSEAEDDE